MISAFPDMRNTPVPQMKAPAPIEHGPLSLIAQVNMLRAQIADYAKTIQELNEIVEMLRQSFAGLTSDDIVFERGNPPNMNIYLWIPKLVSLERSITEVASESMDWFAVTGVGDTEAVVGEGYGCYAGEFEQIGDGSTTKVTGFSSDGTFYLCAKVDFSATSDWWSLVKTSSSGALPTNSDEIQYYPIARVTVASNKISQIEQLFNQWCIYENRV